MQVNNEAPAAPCTGAQAEARAAGEGTETVAPSRAGQRFRKTLERKRRDPTGVSPDGASAAAMAGWFRPEFLPAPPRAAGIAAGPAVVDRVLIGAGPEGAQARIRIAAGALAGTEIQLSGGAAGQAVEARLLTHAASSRQTLSSVMDEIRLRLRDRGIVLSTKAPGARSTAPAHAARVTPNERAGARR